MNKSKDHSIFTKNINPKLAGSNMAETVGETYSSIVNKLKGYAKLNSNDVEANIAQEENLGFFEKMKGCVKNSLEVEKSYKVFFIMLATGLGLIMISLMFLPIVWMSPQKFVSLFSLGCLVSLFSFIFVYGTSEYLEMLFSRKRLLFTMLFLFSIGLGIYFSFNKTYYLISLACAVVQMITLVVFTLSFIPGGGMGIYFIKNMLMSPLNYAWNKITGN
jgi:hypothetical protein